jgi:hypothetical protein
MDAGTNRPGWIWQGAGALVWLAEMCPSKCAGASAGFVKVFRKVETGWPTGTVDNWYLWTLREQWGDLVDSEAPKPVLDAYKHLNPPGEMPPEFQKARSRPLFKRSN